MTLRRLYVRSAMAFFGTTIGVFCQDIPQFDSTKKILDSLISKRQYIEAYKNAISYESITGNTVAGSDTGATYRAYVNLYTSTLKKLIAIPSTPDSILRRIDRIIATHRNEFTQLNAGDSAIVHFSKADSNNILKNYKDAFEEYILADLYKTMYIISERMRLDNNYILAEEHARLFHYNDVKNIYDNFLHEPESLIFLSMKDHLDRKYRTLITRTNQSRDDKEIRQHRTTFYPTFYGSAGFLFKPRVNIEFTEFPLITRQGSQVSSHTGGPVASGDDINTLTLAFHFEAGYCINQVMVVGLSGTRYTLTTDGVTSPEAQGVFNTFGWEFKAEIRYFSIECFYKYIHDKFSWIQPYGSVLFGYYTTALEPDESIYSSLDIRPVSMNEHGWYAGIEVGAQFILSLRYGLGFGLYGQYKFELSQADIIHQSGFWIGTRIFIMI